MNARMRMLLAAMRMREWVGPPPGHGYPGRRVVARIGRLQVERVIGSQTWPLVQTGARMRADGWNGSYIEAVRLHVPWPYGALIFADVTSLPENQRQSSR